MLWLSAQRKIPSLSSKAVVDVKVLRDSLEQRNSS